MSWREPRLFVFLGLGYAGLLAVALAILQIMNSAYLWGWGDATAAVNPEGAPPFGLGLFLGLAGIAAIVLVLVLVAILRRLRSNPQ